jgi:hypothetical protein
MYFFFLKKNYLFLMGENNLSDKKNTKFKRKLVVKYLHSHLSSVFRKNNIGSTI